MHGQTELPTTADVDDSSDGALRPATTALRNFVLIALHQVLVRIGWIFKTESIVMPAFLDFIGGGPVLRGCLPLLNRFGFSLPPVLFARRLKLAPRKSRVVVVTTFCMALPFAILSAIWFLGGWRTPDGTPAPWLPYVFLALYGLFFCITGVNQLGAHAVQGKLIAPTVRGRLFSVAVVVGAPLAILAAATLMPSWLRRPDRGFGQIFAITAAMFALAAIAMGLTREAPDDHQEEKTSAWRRLQGAWSALMHDANCRRLALLAALFSTTFTMFPHYQALGRAGPASSLEVLVEWVCIQNAATAAFGLLAGPLADRYGNRTALHLTVFGSALAPLAALLLEGVPAASREAGSWLMFVPLGFTPVTIRFLINYTLEIARQEDHPQFVSAMGVCLALPVIVLSPLAGWFVAIAGFRPLFFLGLAALLAAGFQTFRIVEPRHNH